MREKVVLHPIPKFDLMYRNAKYLWSHIMYVFILSADLLVFTLALCSDLEHLWWQ